MRRGSAPAPLIFDWGDHFYGAPMIQLAVIMRLPDGLQYLSIYIIFASCTPSSMDGTQSKTNKCSEVSSGVARILF